MLQLCNIVKNYPTATVTVQALKGVSLSFREHEFVAILGPSGCGKSTMLNIIGGLDRYTDGDLLIGGVSTKTFDDLHWDAYRNATIGFVFQSYNLIPHLTVLENVEMALALAGQKKKDRRTKAVAALHRVGMGDEINKRPNQLSGGQMQRVAIARALVSNPKIILADEPTGALDSELSVQVMDLLKEISETCLVIMVTHNAELATEYCSRICRFKDGMLISDSNPYTEEAPAPENAPEQLAIAEGEFVTTDTVSVDEEPVIELEEVEEGDHEGGKRVVGGAILDPDEPDYSKMYDKEEEESRAKKVSNRKRKKAMKGLDQGSKEELDKLGVNSLSKKKKTPENKKDKSFKPTSMSAGMAFGISLRNLISKKGRTILTAFASSIGIIGLGLVLSIYNGFKGYVKIMQTETMAGMPLGIYEYNVGVEIVDEMMGMMTNMFADDPAAYPDTDELTTVKEAGSMDMINKVMSAFLGQVTQNDMSEEFDEYLHSKLNPGDYAAISAYYGLRYNLIQKITDGDGVRYKDVSTAPPVSSVMSIAMTIFGQQGLQSDFWQLLVGDEENMLAHYDLIGENSRYPQNKNEILLCVNEDNTISEALISTFQLDVGTDTLTPDTFIGQTLKLVKNDDYYAAIEDNGNYFRNFDKYFDQVTTGSGITSNSRYAYKDSCQSELEDMYNKGEDLTIVGVIRHKKDGGSKYLSNAICYTPELQSYFLNESYNSRISVRQREIKDEEEELVSDPEKLINVPRSTVLFGSATDQDIIANDNILAIVGKSRGYTSFLRSIGAVKVPAYINVYPADYDQKTKIIKTIDGYAQDYNKRIGYLDVAGMIISELNMIIDLMGVLLIAVASISLVVSSVMIGVITANSVVERIREIGILRALGARKVDIRNVFVAETSILGLIGGLLGIVITYILSPIISLIIEAATGGVGTGGVANLLSFNPLHALLLVVLSLVLTVISGVAPAIMASRKNVVDALRIE